MKEKRKDIFGNFSHKELEFGKGFVLFLGIIFLVKFFPPSDYQISVFIYTIILLTIGYWVFFKTVEIEKFLINNITKISFILIVGFLFIPTLFIQQNKEIFYMIGAIFVFWYGYKKYEIEKDKKVINSFLNKNESKKHDSNQYIKFLQILFLEKEANYISHNAWNTIEKQIKNDISILATDKKFIDTLTLNGLPNNFLIFLSQIVLYLIDESTKDIKKSEKVIKDFEVLKKSKNIKKRVLGAMFDFLKNTDKNFITGKEYKEILKTQIKIRAYYFNLNGKLNLAIGPLQKSKGKTNITIIDSLEKLLDKTINDEFSKNKIKFHHKDEKSVKDKIMKEMIKSLTITTKKIPGHSKK